MATDPLPRLARSWSSWARTIGASYRHAEHFVGALEELPSAGHHTAEAAARRTLARIETLVADHAVDGSAPFTAVLGGGPGPRESGRSASSPP